MRTALLLGLLLVSALLTAPAPAQETDAPALAIVSRLGGAAKVKLYNEEGCTFLARRAGADAGAALNRVRFVFYEEGGSPSRTECVLAVSEDRRHWGEPPSRFRLPLETRDLPMGRYRLRAEKPGYRPAEVKIVLARFEVVDLKAIHDRDSYRASYRLQLQDLTETRKEVPVRLRVEGPGGTLVDEHRSRVHRVAHRDGLYTSPAVLRLSSLVEMPDRARPESERTGRLKVVPGCRLVAVLDGVRFPWRVPLPPERKSGLQSD